MNPYKCKNCCDTFPSHAIKEITWDEKEKAEAQAATDIRVLVEATDQLIAETEGFLEEGLLECDCVEAWASDVEPRMCARHAAIEALKPFMEEKK